MTNHNDNEFRAATLGRFIAETAAEAIPPQVRARAQTMLLDVLASAAGGFPTALATSKRGAAEHMFPGGTAGVWYATERLSPAGAAFANSGAATALDIDDGHRGAAGHAGGAVVPVALAMAEAYGASGPALVDAIVLGYDIALRIGASRHTHRIEHYNSGVWAVYGAAAAAGRLIGLDAGQMTQALAIAGAEAPMSLPTGVSKRTGSMVKEGLPWAAVTGMAAAKRARAGGTGPEDLLDRPDVYDFATMTGALGERFEITQTYLKPYACCRYTHAPIDAITVLRRPGAPVRSLTVEVFAEGLNLQNSPAPHSLEAAQYSYPFCCALAALRGPDALRPMRPEMLADADVLDLAARVDLRASPDFASDFPARTPARVTLDQGDGPKTLTVEYPRGDVANPMPREEIEEKFRVLAEGFLPEWTVAAVTAAADGLERDGPEPLYSALAGRGAVAPVALATR